MSFGSVFALALHLASAGTPTHLTPMLGPELRAVFSGVSARSELTFGRPEAFRSDGTYALPARVQIGGRFWIENDTLCVTTDVEPKASCRSFGRSADGGIFLTAQTKGGVAEPISSPIPFKITSSHSVADPEGT